MRKILLILALVLSACGNFSPQTPTPLSIADSAAKTTAAYVEMTAISLQRGRISVETAQKNLATAKSVQAQLQTAETLLKGCPAPCAQYDSLLKSLQPTLFDLERQMREAQGASK